MVDLYGICYFIVIIHIRYGFSVYRVSIKSSSPALISFWLNTNKLTSLMSAFGLGGGQEEINKSYIQPIDKTLIIGQTKGLQLNYI